jgi:ribonucleoside-triphosphate reductase (thioredoxin)
VINSGEPGFYFSDNENMGTNPCAEIALNPFQFCNLVEVNASDIKDQDDLNDRVYWASVIGTLQASYTDFHYLRPIWKETTEKEALLGIGMTGIASGAVMKMNLQQAVNQAIYANDSISDAIGINKAARITCVKPSGTSSLVLGTSSGIHAWHDEYYVRRMRVGKNEAMYTYLSLYHPEMLEDDVFKPTQQAVVSVPQSAPLGAITRNDEGTAIRILGAREVLPPELDHAGAPQWGQHTQRECDRYNEERRVAISWRVVVGEQVSLQWTFVPA